MSIIQGHFLSVPNLANITIRKRFIAVPGGGGGGGSGGGGGGTGGGGVGGGSGGGESGESSMAFTSAHLSGHVAFGSSSSHHTSVCERELLPRTVSERATHPRRTLELPLQYPHRVRRKQLKHTQSRKRRETPPSEFGEGQLEGGGGADRGDEADEEAHKQSQRQRLPARGAAGTR